MFSGKAGRLLSRITAAGRRGIFFVMIAVMFLNGFCCVYGADAGSVQESYEDDLTQKVLRVGYVTDWIPVSFLDEKSGELQGISRMIFDQLMEMTGLKFEYVPLPLQNVTYEYLRSENLDLITSVENNNVNKNSNGILVSIPYLSSKKVIIGNPSLEFDQDKNLKIAVSTGSQTLKKVLNDQYPNFEIVDYDSIEACFGAVKENGGPDLLIQNQYVAEYWMDKPQYEGLKIIPLEGLDDKLCFSAVVPFAEELTEEEKREVEEKQELIQILNRAIEKITDDEVASYIIEATMSYQYEYDFSDFLYRYRYYIMGLVLAALLFCVLIFLASTFYVRSMRAQAESRAKGKFLSAMSHEMRTPLNGLTGLHYIMSQNLRDEGKMSDALQQAGVMTRYLLSLVNDILEMSELRENQITLETKPFSIRLMLEALQSMERGRMEEKGITFKVEGNLSFPGLLGDEMRVEQVLLKLTDNAWKYTPRGGEVTVQVSQEAVGGGKVETKIVVTDTGCGMSREFMNRIFDSFTQERTTVSKGNQGTGLGMAISYLVAKLMGGDLQVESEPGKGSRFTFLFVAEQTDEPYELENCRILRREDAGKKKILVAEDNELNAEILIELLTEGGYEAVRAENGREAMEIFAASAPGEFSVILMDLMMPEKDGFEASRGIRRMDRPDAEKVKIYACTANTLSEDRKKAYESGMDDFISKPVDMSDLFRKLEL